MLLFVGEDGVVLVFALAGGHLQLVLPAGRGLEGCVGLLGGMQFDRG